MAVDSFCLTNYGQGKAEQYHKLAMRAALDIARKYRLEPDEAISLMWPVYLWVIARLETRGNIKEGPYVYRRVTLDMMSELRYVKENYYSRSKFPKNRVSLDDALEYGDGRKQAEDMESSLDFKFLSEMAGRENARVLSWRFADDENFKAIGQRLGITESGAFVKTEAILGRLRKRFNAIPPPREGRRNVRPKRTRVYAES